MRRRFYSRGNTVEREEKTRDHLQLKIKIKEDTGKGGNEIISRMLMKLTEREGI